MGVATCNCLPMRQIRRARLPVGQRTDSVRGILSILSIHVEWGPGRRRNMDGQNSQDCFRVTLTSVDNHAVLGYHVSTLVRRFACPGSRPWRGSNASSSGAVARGHPGGRKWPITGFGRAHWSCVYGGHRPKRTQQHTTHGRTGSQRFWRGASGICPRVAANRQRRE